VLPLEPVGIAKQPSEQEHGGQGGCGGTPAPAGLAWGQGPPPQGPKLCEVLWGSWERAP